MEKIERIANELYKEKVQAGGWSSNPSRFHFLNYGTFFIDNEDEERYRCVMPESGSPVLWLPKCEEITVMGEQRVQLGLQFPVWKTVTVISLPKKLEEYITKRYILPTEDDFWALIESAEEIEIHNYDHSIVVNGVYFLFPGRIYQLLKEILARGFLGKVKSHNNQCITGFCFFNLLGEEAFELGR